jgi:hypothetical protein
VAEKRIRRRFAAIRHAGRDVASWQVPLVLATAAACLTAGVTWPILRAEGGLPIEATLPYQPIEMINMLPFRSADPAEVASPLPIRCCTTANAASTTLMTLWHALPPSG